MKQVICYLYAYENGKQTRNVGFIKCMVLPDKVVFQIHGKGIDCDKDVNLQMYLFTSKEDGNELVDVGIVEVDNQIVNYKMTINGMTLEEVETFDGILLQSREKNIFGATWKKEEVDLRNFWIKQEEDIACGYEESEVDMACGCEKVESGMDYRYEEAEMEMTCGYEEPEVEMACGCGGTETEITCGCEAPEVEVECECEKLEKSITYEKIERQGISRLPQREWRLANNSFLLHGYYNYKHLLFIREEERLYLGIPGVYYTKEADAARTFGFPVFYRVAEGEIALKEGEYVENVDFGYWCRRVTERPDFDRR